MGLLLSQESPDGSLQCVVEDDGSTIYLYLRSARNEDFPFRPVWVRNLVPAPQEFMPVRGVPPVMPARHCRHPGGAGPLEESKLRFVWLPEGNGVALYEGEEMLATIPPGSGMDRFRGYARDAIGQGPVAWALDPENPLHARFSEAGKYWERWRQDPDPWQIVQDRQIEAYTRQLGKYSHYYAIDGKHWPPKALIRIPYGEHVAVATVGVCLRPQPNVELYYESDWKPLHRIEFGALLRADLGEPAIDQFMNYVSAQAGMPWSQFTWLSHGHSIRCRALEGSPYTAVILANSRQFGPYVELDDWDDLPVWLLWMMPVTEEELDVAKEKRSDTVLSKIQYPR